MGGDSKFLSWHNQNPLTLPPFPKVRDYDQPLTFHGEECKESGYDLPFILPV